MKCCLNNIVAYLNEYFLLIIGIKLSASESIKATVWLKIQLLLRQNSSYYIFSSCYDCISYHSSYVDIDANCQIYPARSNRIKVQHKAWNAEPQNIEWLKSMKIRKLVDGANVDTSVLNYPN